MAHLIDKSALVAEIERICAEEKALFDEYCRMGFEPSPSPAVVCMKMECLLSFLDALEVKEIGDDFLEKFKSLQHITKDLHQALEDWGYAPNLYHFDGSWHVDWISCEEGDSIKGFTGDTAEEAINEAYNWFHSTFCNG